VTRAELTVERYRRTRFWGLYEAGVLLCVTVYKKGAEAVKTRIERGTPLPLRPPPSPPPPPPPPRIETRAARDPSRGCDRR
jgi:hypothetical protein